jgi:pimeloyl-ACP methyl ester carboxylesterase
LESKFRIINEEETLVTLRDGKRLNVLMKGEGNRAMAFLHGLGENHNFFTFQIDEFGQGRRIFSIDQRGHGKSYKPKPPEKLSLQVWTDDVYDVLKGGGVDEAVLMGHSFGGTVSLNFAIQHPEMTKGVITTGGLSELEPDPWKQLEIYINEYERIGLNALKPILTEYNPELDLYPSFAHAPENKELTDRMNKVYAEDDPYAFVQGSRAVNDFALTPELGKIKCPVLILAGDSDIWVPVSHSIKMSKGIPRSYLKVFNQVCHNPHIEQPEFTNELIRDFLGMIGW